MIRGQHAAVLVLVVDAASTQQHTRARVATVASDPPHPTAEAACASYNFSRKVELMHGFGWPKEIDGYTRNSGCGFECGRQFFRWDNGPQGFSDQKHVAGNSTQWPSSVNIAATFDPKLASEWGIAMGEEWWAKGTNFFEGPGLNVLRVPQNGRTFEYLSGEDPVIGRLLGVPLIQGVQQNVMSVSKHYILNNQETDRAGVNEIVDEKTIMELYAPPFEAAAPHTASYMCAYNRINGNYACENEHTLKHMLRDYFNFSGFVVSDWGATHSTSAAINAGLDVQMPDGKHFNEEMIQKAIDEGNVTMKQINESCVRILSPWFKLPSNKRYPCNGGICINHNVSTPAKKQLARKLSAMSTVLLQRGAAGASMGTKFLLPLNKENLKAKGMSVLLMGEDAAAPYVAGEGSGGVANSNVLVSPLAAFRQILSGGAAGGAHVSFEPANSTESLRRAVQAAAKVDVVIVFASAHSGEGSDRADLLLSGRRPCKTQIRDPSLCDGLTGAIPMEEIINLVANKNNHTIVVAAAPGPIRTDPWRDVVNSILCPFLPGEQYGNAITDIIFGDVVPQAKLPVTFPLHDDDQGFSTLQWPGVPSKEFEGHLESHYSEKQIVGYRWYDKHDVAPAFAFGFGLTYGSFDAPTLAMSGRQISYTVRRSTDPQTVREYGANPCETVQFYFSYPGAATDPEIPAKVLRYFEKVCFVEDGPDELTVSYTYTDRDVSNWDVAKKAFVVTKGEYLVYGLTASQGDANAQSAKFTV